MDKELKKIINETLTRFFKDAPEKMVQRSAKEVYADICPHCKQEIYERHEYTEDGGITWRHAECKGLICRPETPLEEIVSWLRPYVQEAREQRKATREAMGLPALSKVEGLPPSGCEKYDKQEPGGTFGTSNSSTIGNV